MITLFYDSYCPLCVKEMAQLRQYDHQHQLDLVDIHSDRFADEFSHIDKHAADRMLHAQLDDGTLLLGLDATRAVWKAVGKHSWLAILRLPVVRWFADQAYLLFAKHRYKLSYWLTGKARCEPCEKGYCDRD
ncbi:DUF393 domain-containing protein [Marinomonas piezotolerans]|uniref:DUF393 domain-containing protein n=1 Tax=Marinomonas piezotolerans TaxID=2213058 RepID=A0A370U974_9GAMM|nr:DUF393 domain-containing protein [Marinomonas piezotolerans]RDL44298.1 DUF393 domain-containing protein [Marinomonas piezotolerans]